MTTDRQIDYVLKKYIIPNKKFDVNEIKTVEELNATTKGFDKFLALSQEQQFELLKKYTGE
jgi:hypothetical protein